MTMTMREMDKLGGGGELNNNNNGLNSHTVLIIKLPDTRSLRIISRSLFLAMLLLALPSLGSIMRASSNAPLYEYSSITDFDGFKILLRDLVEEGLIKKGDKGFILGAASAMELDGLDHQLFLRDAGIDLLTGADLRQKQHEVVFDYAYAPSLSGIHVIDGNGILKDGGLVMGRLDPWDDELRLVLRRRNFKIVYLRRFGNTVVVAMRKMEEEASSNSNSGATAEQVVCGINNTSRENKKKKKLGATAVLKELEDVYLEPPRRAALANKKSSFTSSRKTIKFLPDLLKDPLDEYPRRVFISDDSNALDWFYNNYPMRGQEFEVYVNHVMDNDDGWEEWDWIRKIKVRDEDYVVMKAEAQVVEQMMRDKTLCLVDELFLECKNGSKRAYSQCLALYGQVRDEGIAVHQWWF